ncbi:hypothetical protein RB595_010103 [Gaeumannomyces hyphopodioides]
MPDASDPASTAATGGPSNASLPSYNEATQPGQDIMPPTKLVLDGQQIREDAPDSPLLYSLSLGLSDVSPLTTEVELSRVEPRQTGSGQRERHIYDLRRMRRTHGGFERVPSESPHFYVQRASARMPGPAGVGLKKGRSLIPGRPARATAVPVDLSGKASKFGIPTFDKKADCVFAISGAEWAGPGGGVVAVTHDDKEDTRHSLVVTTALPRAQFEMLVALWCCHVWEFVTANAPKTHEGMDGVARKMKLAKDFGWTPANTGPAGGTMGFGGGGGVV